MESGSEDYTSGDTTCSSSDSDNVEIPEKVDITPKVRKTKGARKNETLVNIYDYPHI